MCFFNDNVSTILQHIALFLEVSGLYLATLDAWNVKQLNAIKRFFSQIYISKEDFIDSFSERFWHSAFNFRDLKFLLSSILSAYVLYHYSDFVNSLDLASPSLGYGIKPLLYFLFFGALVNIGTVVINFSLALIRSFPLLVGGLVSKLLFSSGNQDSIKGLGVFLASVGVSMEVYQVITIHWGCNTPVLIII
ncbi:hypothetical protein [Pseudoalteromonas sp. R3]|uniref:hypothetical protein n=1 Tax=Pseudoalteromonas sp. R3 TaxID=1709477 RepID=UPI0006B5D811|nr:hypothetical protein [Pseudoalteromonas sp. R3]AZZ98744.1 hypothetical protein ELR70_17560 [Pseudoalteromonas sp. R3]